MKVRCLIYICLIFSTVALQQPVRGETEYYAVLMGGKKVGYSAHKRVVTGREVTTTEKVSVSISRLNTPVTMKTIETSVETVDGKPLSFDSLQEMGIMTVRISGTIDEKGTVNATTFSMGSERKVTLELPSGAVMVEGLRLLTLDKGLKEGTSYKAKLFSPSLLQTVDVEVSIGPKKNVDLLGRIVSVTEVISKVTMSDGTNVISTSYVDKDLKPEKNVVSIMGMQCEMIACSKEFALGELDVLEIVDKMFVVSPEPLGDLSSVESISYYLRAIDKSADLKVPEGDNQRVQRLGNGELIVVVEPTEAPKGAGFPYKGSDKTVLEALKPTRFLQSDSKEIIELAKKAVGNTGDAAEAAKKIEEFVAGYIESLNFSVGYATATEVAASRQGDCSEFAVLTAAMCRAVGIPAQVATGVVYVEDFHGHEGFGGHAWTLAYVGGKWIGLDSAFKGSGLGVGGYGPGHITLACGNGNPEGFFNLLNTLGQFEIYKVEIKRQTGE